MLKPITIEKHIHLPIHLHQLWNLVSRAEGLGSWLNAEVEIEACLGGRFQQIGHFQERDYVLQGRVLAVKAHCDLVIAYRLVTRQDEYWPIYTTLRFVLHGEDGGSQLDILHSGFENLPLSSRNGTYDAFVKAWDEAAARLKESVA